MKFKVVTDSVSVKELREIGQEFYADMIKAAIDVDQEKIAFGGEYHIDANNVLIKDGSRQSDIWGFNLYFDKPRNEWLEYIALINIKPADGSRDMYIEDSAIREKIRKIVDNKVK